MSNNSQVWTILILSANPRGTSRLRLDEEVREIKEGLRRAKERNRLFYRCRLKPCAIEPI